MDKHIPSKTSRSVSSVPWMGNDRMQLMQKQRSQAVQLVNRSKFETLQREIKADIRDQHDLCVNNLVGDVKTIPGTFIGTITSTVRKKDTRGTHPF